MSLSGEVEKWSRRTDEAVAEIFTGRRDYWNDLGFCEAG